MSSKIFNKINDLDTVLKNHQDRKVTPFCKRSSMRLTFQLKRFHRIKITFEEIVQRCVYVELIKDGKEGEGEEGADKPITLTIIENEQ